MEVDGTGQVANAKREGDGQMEKMIEAKTRSSEQQAMLQEKVAEKLWDLRRWNTILLDAHLILFHILLDAHLILSHRARVREGGGAKPF